LFSSRRRHTRWPRDWSSDVALPIWARPDTPAARDSHDAQGRRRPEDIAVRRRARAGSERGAALAAALVALAVSAALVAGLADVVRTEIILARERRAMGEALAAADACIAQSLTALPLGWDLRPRPLRPG